MDQKPIVTFAGDKSVFSNIEPGLVSGLPTEAVEWKRSYGRTSRQVYVECDFHQWSSESISSSGSGSIQGQPVFHTFWTDVMDMDQYRQGVKEEIVNWLAMLRKNSASTDWMIILVETPEAKKGNKFPLRATVLDKLKQDIGGKTPERCVSLTDPSRADSRAAESMQSFLHKFRQFFLQSYNKVLNKFEENIRSQREKRNEESWNFCQYFLLQEQLAFVYENLGLYDESLIQYDELDALFTQFILNSSVGDSPAWLERFNKDLSEWSPLSLDTDINMKLRDKLEQKCPSLMDMRNYLFSRQCHQLLLGNKTSDVASRTIAFLHNTAQELEILEVKEAVEGSLDSWVMLACLEVVQTCDKQVAVEVTSPAGGQLTVHTASLWSLAREKLLKLGHLCGLMPGQSPSSDQLHTVISLTGCLPDDDGDQGVPAPGRRLKESLSSNSAFQRNYLEMCEIAISSFKHIGRIRSARLVGRDLAAFYIQMGEHVKAATFLVEALKTFQQEKWLKLSLQTMLDLASCYSSMKDNERYARMCAQISSSEAASELQKNFHFDEFIRTMKDLENEENLFMPAEDVFNFTSCDLVDKSRDQIIPGDELTFDLEIYNYLPKALSCNSVKVALTYCSKEKKEKEKLEAPGTSTSRKPVTRSPSTASNSQLEMTDSDQTERCVDMGEESDQLDMVEQLDYKQDKSLCSARLVCRNTNKALKRKDSSGSMLRDLSQQQRGDFQNCISVENIVLEPGLNTIKLKTVAGVEGGYTMLQMSVKIQSIEFLYDIDKPCPLFKVISSPPVVGFNKDDKELFAGLDNVLTLSVQTGSQVVTPGTKIQLQSSRGMKMRSKEDEGYSDQIEVEIAGGEAYQVIDTKVHVKCALGNQKDSSTIEHRVQITDPWSAIKRDVFIHFTPAFYTTFNLLTALQKKFLQIFVFPVADNCFIFSQHKLSLSDNVEELNLTPINNDDDVLVSDANCEAGYLWQLNIPTNTSAELSDKIIKAKFSLEYKEKSSETSETGKYEATFQFQNFLTLYTIQAKIEPSKGSEFCRAGTMCPMTVQLEQCNISPYNNLYYEVRNVMEDIYFDTKYFRL